MNKTILSTLIAISAMTSTGLCATQPSKEESTASLVIGRILNSIDYKNSSFTFHFFEGAFIKKDKNAKSNLRIDALNVESSIKFKTDVIIEGSELSKEPSKSEKAKQWQPKISLLSKDLEILSSINANNNDELEMLIQFNKKSDSVNNGLTVTVGNQFNTELIRMNFISFNIKLIRNDDSSEMKVLGTCLARKKVAKTIQPISTCTFSGVIDSEKDTHDIRVKFGDKVEAAKKLN